MEIARTFERLQAGMSYSDAMNDENNARIMLISIDHDKFQVMISYGSCWKISDLDK